MEKIGVELFLWCDVLKLAFIDFYCFSPQSQSGTFLLRLKSFLETYTIFPCTKFFYHHFLFNPRRISNSCNQKIVADTYPLPQVSSHIDDFPTFVSSPELSSELSYYFHLPTRHFQSILNSTCPRLNSWSIFQAFLFSLHGTIIHTLSESEAKELILFTPSLLNIQFIKKSFLILLPKLLFSPIIP